MAEGGAGAGREPSSRPKLKVVLTCCTGPNSRGRRGTEYLHFRRPSEVQRCYRCGARWQLLIPPVVQMTWEGAPVDVRVTGRLVDGSPVNLGAVQEAPDADPA